jgi:hypothetical protein
MRFRRGLVYAAVHLSVTVGLVYWQEAPFWDYIPTVPAPPRGVPHEMAVQGADEGPSEDRPPINPCEAAAVSERPFSSQEKILAVDNLPIALITGWHLPCSEPSRLDKLIQAHYGFTQKSELITGRLIAVLALVLWFFVGGNPLMRKRFRHWYSEPGPFMTVSTLVSMLLLGIGWSIARISPHVPERATEYVVELADLVTQVAALPMIFVLAGWGWWVGLFVYTRWKAMRRRQDRRALAEE